jgi:hypothetical protein
MNGLGNLLSKEEKFIFWALLAMIPRGLFHFFAFKMKLEGVILDMYYLLILYFSLLFFIERMAKIFFKVTIEDTQGYYLTFIKYWCLIFPVVPFITLATGSSYYDKTRIELFRYIPTFMVENNFLPLGMVFVIPLIIYFLMVHLRQYLNLKFFQSFILVAVANTIAYILYYQWLFNLFFRLTALFSRKTALCVYAILEMTVLLFIEMNLTKRNILSPKWLKLGYFMLYMTSFLLVSQVGKYFITAYHIDI